MPELATKTLTIEGPAGPVTVIVGQATVRIGMARTRIRTRALEQKGLTEDEQILAMFTYPDILAGTLSVVGMDWPPTFEQFLELPEWLIVPWENAVYELNPHWLPQADEPGEPKADGDKTPESTSAVG